MIQASHPEEHAAGNRFRGGVQAGAAYTEFIPGPRQHVPSPQRPVPSQAGAFAFHDPKEVFMFEGQQSQLEDVMQSNPEFRRLYYQHKELDKKVMDAELGVLPMDDTTLSQMKREKLAAKDRLTRMYATLEH